MVTKQEIDLGVLVVTRCTKPNPEMQTDQLIYLIQHHAIILRPEISEGIQKAILNSYAVPWEAKIMREYWINNSTW